MGPGLRTAPKRRAELGVLQAQPFTQKKSASAETHFSAPGDKNFNVLRQQTDVLEVALPSHDTVGTPEAPPSGVRLTSEHRPRVCYAHNVANDDERSDRADPLATLAADAGAGNAVAIRRLLDAVAPAMLGVVRAILGHSDRDAEDVLQDSLVGLIRGLSSFRGDSSFLHFARTIALRRSLDQRRKRARHRSEIAFDSDASADDDERSIAHERDLRSSERSPASSALAARRREAFRALLEELRPEQAEAFARRVLLGCSMQEIAQQTGVPLDTVKSRLRLAKAALRTRIKDDPTLLELSETDDVDAP